jgi:hypothetical protein
MPKRPQGQKRPTKSKKLPRKLPDNPISRAVAIRREIGNQDIGDTADKIMRAPKKGL